jgi:hypothetical protein
MVIEEKPACCMHFSEKFQKREFFFENALATHFSKDRVSTVPLIGSFGDWATPGLLTVGLFLRAQHVYHSSHRS